MNTVDLNGLHSGDKGFKGYPKTFRNWAHRVEKPGNLDDFTNKEISKLYQEWIKKGKPGPDTRGVYGSRGSKNGGSLKSIAGLGALFWKLWDVTVNAAKKGKDPCNKNTFGENLKESFNEYMNEPTLFDTIFKSNNPAYFLQNEGTYL